jgi:CBS domain-containing protein
LLLTSIFTSLPVVDRHDRPIGIITQGDLIHKGGLPVRLSLLSETGQERIEAMMHALAQQTVADLMTQPAVTLTEGQPLLGAVDLLLNNHLKRMPVVEKEGQLVGMLSRLDILTIVMRETPDWNTFQAQAINVADRRCVGDIIRRDTYTVLPETTVDTILQLISRNDIQQVAVVNAEGTLVGMIADSDLLRFFLPKPAGLRSLLAQLSHSLHAEVSQKLEVSADTTAREIMRTDMPTIRDQASIEDAIGLMIEQRLKRLPVVDDRGHFQGMISRESLLRTGFHH